MKKIYTATEVISGIIEAAYWAAACVLLVLFILTLLPGNTFNSMLHVSDGEKMLSISVSGLEVQLLAEDGSFVKKAVSVFSVCALPLMCLSAMVFRNVNLILKTAQGRTRFSQGATPFQKDVTRMIREIGFFLLIAAVLSFLAGTAAHIIIGDAASGSLDLTRVVLGLLMVCLSQAFADGEQLRQDVDGLL